MSYDALTDPLRRSDPKSQEIAYNNNTDRFKMELPARGDPSASGVVSVISASGTDSIPVYLTSPIPVAVIVDIESDSIKIFSSSGTPDIPVYLTSDLDKANDSVTSWNVSSSGTTDIPVYLTTPIQVIADIGDEIKVLSASGTSDIPVYLQSNLDSNNDSVTVVSTDLDIRDLSQSQDNVRIYSASGTTSIPVYLADEPLDVSEINPAVLRTIENTWAQLTAPGNTLSLYVLPNSKHTFQYKVSAINTSIKVAASGSLDNSDWFNLDANDALTEHTGNGTFGMVFDGKIKYTLFSFVEEVGGTNATIDTKYLGGN